MEVTKATKSNIRSIIIKMLETAKSYLESELMSISILFYYLSSRCEGLANEVLQNEVLQNEVLQNEGLQNEGLQNEVLANDGPINESWP